MLDEGVIYKALGDKLGRLFACWCADSVLVNFEKYHPKDARVRTAITVALLYAEGKASKHALGVARCGAMVAGNIAVAWKEDKLLGGSSEWWLKTSDAAWDAARYAAVSCTDERSEDAARNASFAAAWAKALDADIDGNNSSGRHCALDRAKKEQTKKLVDMMYAYSVLAQGQVCDGGI